jgi:KUP system potassium uptake protein
MITSSVLAFLAVRSAWKKSVLLSAAIVAPFLLVEGVFLGSNLLKVPDGGYVPLLLAAVMMIVMWTWARGARVVLERSGGVPIMDVMKGLETNPPHTVPGTAVFLTPDPETAPSALLHNLKHNKVLHERNVLLTVRAAQEPYVAEDAKIEIGEAGPNMKRVTLTFGYMETPNVPRGLALAKKQGLDFDFMSTSFFLSRRSLLPDAKVGMPLWQDHLYIFLSRNATNASEFFRIPTGRVVEMGTQITI